MVHYASCQYRCRVQLLLEYFGEAAYQKCGQCDVCLAKKKEESICSVEDYYKYRSLILQRLEEGMQELHKIVDSVDLTTEATILATIRNMLDNGELVYDDANRLIQTRNLQPK